MRKTQEVPAGVVPAALSGFHPELSYEAYEKDPALRHSVLNRFSTAPHAPLAPRSDSPALAFGRIFHHLALTPKLPLEVTDIEATVEAQAMAKAFHDHPAAFHLLAGAFVEASVFWDVGAVACKSRPDILSKAHLADLKTTRDLRKFEEDAEKYGYHRQLAWYADGVEAAMGVSVERHLLVAVEKKAPYRVEVFEVSPRQIEAGRRQNAINLALYKRATGGAP